MADPDLNLLVTLDVLLAEGSVARAAKRLRLSPSAMSRALARLRETTGDPLLVRAGRGLVPTPRAVELRERVGQLVQDAQAVLRPAEMLDPSGLVRTFTLRTSEGFVETFGPALIARAGREAPDVRLRFLQKLSKDSAPLRDGTVDLDTGVMGETTSPEVRVQALFRDRFIGVVRKGHLLDQGTITPARYAAGGHILVSRRGRDEGPVDEALRALGLAREIVTIVGGLASALALARESDLIATVPELHTGKLRGGMHGFPLPFVMAEIMLSMLWHPRMNADPGHRWLRGCVRDVCIAQAGSAVDRVTTAADDDAELVVRDREAGVATAGYPFVTASEPAPKTRPEDLSEADEQRSRVGLAETSEVLEHPDRSEGGASCAQTVSANKPSALRPERRAAKGNPTV